MDGLKEKFLQTYADYAAKENRIPPSEYAKYNAKRGLRNDDGTGVLVGLTEIGDVHGYIMDEAEKVPVDGRLRYRGYDVYDLVKGFQAGNRFGFEEICFLLLFGMLPDAESLRIFQNILGENRMLPNGFTEDMILKAPSNDIMNKLARSVLVFYSYDDNPDDQSVANIIRQSIELIARFPAMVAYGYQAKRYNYDEESLYIHSPKPELSTAENLLHMVRPDMQFSKLEAEVLDLALVLHAEHGGGNNSAFTVHVVSSSETDTYSAIAAAVGSLKGKKHGGANKQVIGMMEDIKNNVSDWQDEKEVAGYLRKILRKEAYDGNGLIYGLGHAVYTVSDPRAVLLKNKAEELAHDKEYLEEFKLYELVERLSPDIFRDEKGSDKALCANVDFYSGFVYGMLNIPSELYTPIFAIARVAGWCAHRIEEIVAGKRIIRPAYKNVRGRRDYIGIEERESLIPRIQ